MKTRFVPASRTAPKPPASTVTADDTPRSSGAPHSVFEATARAVLAAPRHPPFLPAATFDAAVGELRFDGWLKVRDATVTITRGGVTETVPVQVLIRPGHDSASVGALRLDASGAPRFVFKAGDTRPSAALRGTPYVSMATIGGSLDHDGVDDEATSRMEIAEEAGGVPMGPIVRLGAPAPTMPVTDEPNDVASTEADQPFVAVLSSERLPITGDGGGLEVPGLLAPVELSVPDTLRALDDGSLREGARARVTIGRALDKVGFLPQLGVWVHDVPDALKGAFDTLGLGEPFDPRPLTPDASSPAPRQAPPAHPLAAQVSAVNLGPATVTLLSHDTTLLDSTVQHLATDQRVVVGEARVQTLHVNADRLKLVHYAMDEARGPLVAWQRVERPALAVKQALTGRAQAAQRYDVVDVKVPLEPVHLVEGEVTDLDVDQRARDAAMVMASAAAGGPVEPLGAPAFASAGQSDLRYHLFAAKVAPAPGLVPLAEALRQCRQGVGGDVSTEAALLRLADALGWVPQLGMSVEHARRAL